MVQNTVKLYKWRQRLKSAFNLGAVLVHRFSPCKLPSAATLFLMLGDGGCSQWSALCIKYFHDLYTEGVSSAFEQLMTKYDVIPKTYFFRYLQVLSFIWGMLPLFPSQPLSPPINTLLHHLKVPFHAAIKQSPPFGVPPFKLSSINWVISRTRSETRACHACVKCIATMSLWGTLLGIVVFMQALFLHVVGSVCTCTVICCGSGK